MATWNVNINGTNVTTVEAENLLQAEELAAQTPEVMDIMENLSQQGKIAITHVKKIT